MHIQHFTMYHEPVPDPMRPGRTTRVGRLRPSGNQNVSHGAQTFEPDENGWIEVPQAVGEFLCKFRTSGSGYRTPGEVTELIRLGVIDDVAKPKPPAQSPMRAKLTRATAEAAASS